MARVAAPASTLKAGPAASAGDDKLTVVLPEIVAF
jgi:hypothetical protein